ncbi:MAG: flagella basal body P-ring formation protein FlgA [Alphaproteobacteria bacterium CG_4_10_14_0_8_um_filter_37_21]|nr:MAG: flagella basal body P-ring formation protein FlgA [Alphaproteobacteria bacterium CG_4_10_14_0_8_um_filter_37_21]
MQLFKYLLCLLLLVQPVVSNFKEEQGADKGSVHAEVLSLLNAEISQKVNVTDFGIKLDNWTSSWESDKVQCLKLKDLKISHNQTRFAAQIDGFKTTKRLFGKVEWYIDVPVLNRMLRPGEEIQADDIILQKIESHKINAFHLTDAGQLIGMIGRHSVLKPGVLLTKSDVQAPMVVKRGAVMRVTLKKGSLTVSNKGIALKDAARDATIPIEMMNNNGKKDKKTVYAVVLSSENAEIRL